jgi:hypothetical protein
MHFKTILLALVPVALALEAGQGDRYTHCGCDHTLNPDDVAAAREAQRVQLFPENGSTTIKQLTSPTAVSGAVVAFICSNGKQLGDWDLSWSVWQDSWTAAENTCGASSHPATLTWEYSSHPIAGGGRKRGEKTNHAYLDMGVMLNDPAHPPCAPAGQEEAGTARGGTKNGC